MKMAKEFTMKNLKWIILCICLVAFMFLAEDVFQKEIMKGDIIGYELLSKFFIRNRITPIAKFITNLGGSIVLIVLSLLLLIFIKKKRIGISIMLNLFIATALNLILKNILQRPRPTEYRLIEESGYSFPSGHSMISMAFYGYLKISLIMILSILIVLIGVSRIYLGVHYTSDVLAGFLISISYLIVYESCIKKFLKERE